MKLARRETNSTCNSPSLLRSPSKRSAQTCAPVSVEMSWALTVIVSSTRRTLPGAVPDNLPRPAEHLHEGLLELVDLQLLSFGEPTLFLNCPVSHLSEPGHNGVCPVDKGALVYLAMRSNISPHVKPVGGRNFGATHCCYPGQCVFID